MPTNAYQYGMAGTSESTQSSFYAAEAGANAPVATPSYMGAAASYDASSPAPAPTDPECQPDEEYMRITYEVAPNSPSLAGMTRNALRCRDPPHGSRGRSVSATASPLERNPAGLLRRDWRAALPSLPHLREPVHQLHRRRQTLEVQHVRLDERW